MACEGEQLVGWRNPWNDTFSFGWIYSFIGIASMDYWG